MYKSRKIHLSWPEREREWASESTPANWSQPLVKHGCLLYFPFLFFLFPFMLLHFFITFGSATLKKKPNFLLFCYYSFFPRPLAVLHLLSPHVWTGSPSSSVSFVAPRLCHHFSPCYRWRQWQLKQLSPKSNSLIVAKMETLGFNSLSRFEWVNELAPSLKVTSTWPCVRTECLSQPFYPTSPKTAAVNGCHVKLWLHGGQRSPQLTHKTKFRIAMRRLSDTGHMWPWRCTEAWT